MQNKDNETLEEMIARTMRENGVTHDDESGYADRSQFHIDDRVIYTQQQAQNAYREGEDLAEGYVDPRPTVQQRQTPQHQPRQTQPRQPRQSQPSHKSSQSSKSKSSIAKSSKSHSTQKKKKQPQKNKAASRAPAQIQRGKQRMEYYEDDELLPEEEPQPRKKHHPIRTLICLLLVVVLVAVGAYSAIAWHYIGMVETVETGTRYDVGVVPLESKNVRNILLIGTDTRSVTDSGRADTVILMSINYKTRTVTLTSFMRDSYVNIPNNGWSKLNASYRWGGAELLMDTLELNFHVSVDDYVFVNFESFAAIVDSVGGVKLTVTDDEAAAMQAPMAEINDIKGLPSNKDFITSGGTYNMNGNQALAYARIRYVGRSDFQRTERQREVVRKIIEKAKSSGVSGLNKFATACAKNVVTNMSKGEMFKLAMQLPYLATFEFDELRIPADDMYSGATLDDGQQVLQIDFDANIALIENNVYND